MKGFISKLKFDIKNIKGVSFRRENVGGALIKIKKEYNASAKKILSDKGYVFENMGIGFDYYNNEYTHFITSRDYKD